MLELREREILNTLEKLKELSFVLIGGYAINCYTQPRFSVDCDLVVLNKDEAEKIKNRLVSEGYKEKELPPNIPYSGEFLCFVRKINDYAVSFDILIGSVIDRKTKDRFPAGWIFENSEIRTLTGKSFPLKIKLRIANPEVLIIMKLSSGRKSDLRDIFMLFEKGINFDFVLSELKKYGLEEKLNKFKEYILSTNFKDSLQGVFGKVDNSLFNKIVEKVGSLMI